MSEVLTMTKEKKSASEGLTDFITKNRTVILVVVAVIAAAIVLLAVCLGIKDKASSKGLEQLDSIYHVYTKDADTLEGDELAARQNEALEALKPLAGKGGITGARACLLSADIAFAQKNFENSRDLYLSCAKKQPKAYTAPIAYYNAAACYEELGDNENAAAYYDKAASFAEFLAVTHAYFNEGRVKEAMNDFDGAVAAYEKAIAAYSSDSWANLSQSRIIALKADGKVTK